MFYTDYISGVLLFRFSFCKEKEGSSALNQDEVLYSNTKSNKSHHVDVEPEIFCVSFLYSVLF